MKRLGLVLCFLMLAAVVLAAVLATDDFNRANDTNLLGNWTEEVGGFGFNVTSNTAQTDDIGSDTIAVLGGVTWPTDMYAQAKISVTGTAGGFGVALRADTVANTYYRAVVNKAASANVSVERMVTGTHTVLSTRTTTWTDGNTLKLEVTGTGASIVLKVYQNGTQLGANIADASGGISTINKPGLTYSSTSVSGSVDDFEAGSVSATGSVVPLLLSQRRRRNQ